MKDKKAPIANSALKSWIALNDYLMACDDRRVLAALLDEEMNGRRRRVFATRIHSRIMKLTGESERNDLMEKLK